MSKLKIVITENSVLCSRYDLNSTQRILRCSNTIEILFNTYPIVFKQ